MGPPELRFVGLPELCTLGLWDLLTFGTLVAFVTLRFLQSGAGVQAEAPDLSNNKFGAPEITISLSEITIIRGHILFGSEFLNNNEPT